MDKIQEVTGASAGRDEMNIPMSINPIAEPAKNLIEALTDQVCDQITESLEAVKKTIERRIIIRVLKKTGGNQTEAAKLLGIKRTTLNYKIKRLKIAGD